MLKLIILIIKNNKKTELIRYLFGRQFTLFKDSSNSNLEHFLKLLTNDSINTKNLDKITFNYDKNLNEDKYIYLLENIKKNMKMIWKEYIHICQNMIKVEKFKKE